MAELSHVVVYCDGACSGNPGPGGYAALLIYGAQEKVVLGGSSLTTNNRMELRAALAAFHSLKRPCRVDVFTDSDYLRSGITRWLANWERRNWRTTTGGRVKNQDLWRALANSLKPHQVTWHWVKGHAGNALNERVDRLAVQAIREYGLPGRPDLENEADVPAGPEQG